MCIGKKLHEKFCLFMMRHYHQNLILNCKDIQEKNFRYAIVILNRPILLDKELVVNLWNHCEFKLTLLDFFKNTNIFLASIKILVDGGTNRWLAWLRENSLEDELIPPTMITGDLDSCLSRNLDYFRKKATKVIETFDQNETDFTKTLRVLEPFIEELKLDFVISVCEDSGRIDHILGNINTLFMNLLKPPEILRPVYILSSGSLTWLLSSGQHTIHIPENFRQYWCSLVPIGSRATATTTGLKWNLNNEIMEFGRIVSTSNKYDGKSDEVTVLNDCPLLWSMGINDRES